MRITEHSAEERIGQRGFSRAKDIREHTRHGVDDNHCGQFAARQHVVANRNQFVGKVVNPGVEAFVVSADENNLVERGEFLSLSLRENFAAGVGDDYLARKIFVGLGKHVAHGKIDRFGLKHHARAAAEGRIVNLPVLVEGEVAQLSESHVQDIFFDGALDDTFAEDAREHFRKQRDDVNKHERQPEFSSRQCQSI